MKKAKIIIIAVIVLIILGAVFLKYVKPKLDERREARRLKEASILASATLRAPLSVDADLAAVSQAMPEGTTPLGVGGLTVVA